jgi:hypothetical protein
MKKLTFILIASAIVFCQKASAQFTATSANPTTTSNDVSIKTTVAQGNLTILRDPQTTQVGSVITYPKAGLSIIENFGSGPFGAPCMTCTYANQRSPVFEIVSPTYSSGGGYVFQGYTTPLFTIGGSTQMTLGGIAKPGFSNTTYASNYFDGNSLLKGKVRLTNDAAVIAAADFSNAVFPYTFSVDNGNSRFLGKVQIGNLKRDVVADPNCLLSVNGDMFAKRVVVQTAGWADYVFANDYVLSSLADVEEYITQNKHLPDMPSEVEINASGIDVAEIQKLQQAKIEELTLYIIQLKKELDAVKVLISK